MWVDRLSREGLSRSRIANHVAVASSIYAWALVAEPPLRHAQSAAAGRAAAERREAAAARRARAGGRAAARRARARGPRPVRARLLRRAAPRGDPPTRMAGGARRRRSPATARPARQERGRHAAPAADRRAAAADPPRGVAATGPAATGDRSRRSVMSGKLASARDRGLGRGRPEAHHAARVPPHLRLDADGGPLHAEGAHGVHGPRAICRWSTATSSSSPSRGDDDAAERLNDYLRASRTS